MDLKDLPIIEILKLGLVGLCFLLCLLSFILLQTEQKRTGEPRKRIITSIYVFMFLNFLFFLCNLGIEIIKLNQSSTQIAQENEEMKNKLSNFEKKEKLYQKSWTINGKFKLDYYAGGKDIKYYTIPATNINTYIVDKGITGFTISNFKPIISDNAVRFPIFGFQSSVHCSLGTIDTNEYNIESDIIKIESPISFMKIPRNGGN